MEELRAQHGHTWPRHGHQVLADIYFQIGTRRKRLTHNRQHQGHKHELLTTVRTG